MMLCARAKAAMVQLPLLIRATSIVEQRLYISTILSTRVLCKGFVIQSEESRPPFCLRTIHTSPLLAKKKSKKAKEAAKVRKAQRREVKAIDDDEFDGEGVPESAEDLVDLDELKGKFSCALSDLRREFATKLALRTSQSAFNEFPVKIDAENIVNLQYLGQISMKSANMVHVNLASNPEHLPKVRDALQSSAFNINPRIEGTSIFIDTPRVTREHRENLSKAAKQLGDDHKVKIRHTQNQHLKRAKVGEELFSIDDVRRLENKILEMAKGFNKQIDDAVKQKQKELLSD